LNLSGRYFSIHINIIMMKKKIQQKKWEALTNFFAVVIINNEETRDFWFQISFSCLAYRWLRPDQIATSTEKSKRMEAEGKNAMHVHGGDDILYKTVCNFYLKRHIVFCLTCFFFVVASFT
jgi:hypothetical protein